MIQASLFAVAAMLSVLDSVPLGAEVWNAATPASALATHAPMRRLVQSMETGGETVLFIRHASGEADRGRAIAMRSALVALGIPSGRLRLEPAASEPGILIVELRGTGPQAP